MMMSNLALSPETRSVLADQVSGWKDRILDWEREYGDRTTALLILGALSAAGGSVGLVIGGGKAAGLGAFALPLAAVALATWNDQQRFGRPIRGAMLDATA